MFLGVRVKFEILLIFKLWYKRGELVLIEGSLWVNSVNEWEFDWLYFVNLVRDWFE